MATKVIYRAGLKTIGGTIVEVISKKQRLIFDFGVSYDGQTSEEVLPKVQGIYDGKVNLETAVLLSHLHLDHTKAMNLVHDNIPIYMSEQSNDFLNNLYEIGFSGFLGKSRKINAVSVNKPFELGDFKITFLLVDHDVLGASAILIQNDDINIFYSGDIRLHGYNAKYTYDMIAFIKKLNIEIDVAIFEGVTISFIEDDYDIVPHNNVLEFELEKNFFKLVENNLKDEKLILVNPYIMGLERVKSIFEYAKKKNKKVCVTSDFGYLISKYYNEYDYYILEDDSTDCKHKKISYSNIDSNFIVFFKFLERDKYSKLLQKYKGSIALLQTGGEPLGEYDARWGQLEEFCKQYEIDLYCLGASGHALPEHLIYIIEQINPKYLMPLHSFKPELVKSKKKSIKQVLARENKEYIFEQHLAINID